MANKTKPAPEVTPDVQVGDPQQSAAAEIASEAQADQTAALGAPEVTPDVEPRKLSQQEQRYADIAKRYAKHYPNCVAFHFTSDDQIYLGVDLASANEHQQFIDPVQSVITINVK